jgi:hypothetical protein
LKVAITADTLPATRGTSSAAVNVGPLAIDVTSVSRQIMVTALSCRGRNGYR